MTGSDYDFFEDEDMTHVEATKRKGDIINMRRPIPLPPRERWGEAVPGEGTHCANCEYLKDEEKMICGNKGFIAWNGSNKIPATDPEKYCSIWWEHS
jgi:hypothetical protein